MTFRERIGGLARHQLAAADLDLHPSLSLVTRRGLTILLLLAISGVVGFLPGADVVLFGQATVAVLLRLAIAVAAVVLLLWTYRPVVCVLAHGTRVVFNVPPEHACDRSVRLVAWSSSLLVAVCLVYWIFVRAFTPVFALLSASRWPLTAIDICTLALSLAAIAGIVIGISPLFGKVGDSLAHHVAPVSPPEMADDIQSKCPQCGVLYETGSRFCSFCGHAIV